MGWTARVGITALAAGLLASGAWAALGVSTVAAAEGSIDGLVVKGIVTSTPNSFWYGQMNRDGVCGVIPGCVAARGGDDAWVLTLQLPVAIPGVSTIDVNVNVTNRVPLKSMSMTMTYSSPQLGDLDAAMTIGLRPQARNTEVSLTMDKVTTTGAIATGVASFGAALQPRMAETTARLSEDRVIAGTKVRLAVSKSGIAKVVVTGKGLGFGPPIATGKLYVLAGDKVLCTGDVTRSVGSCKLPRLARGTEVRATVAGSFDNGYPIWNSDADEVK